MRSLFDAFDERLAEIDAYLAFLSGVERLIQSGVPRLGADGEVVTVQQQKILYSSVYLQLYNLVESTVIGCLDAVTKEAISGDRWRPGDLTSEFRSEWVKVIARTNVDLTYEHRLASALELCDYLVETLPVRPFGMEKGGGGNWDDENIEAIARRLGFQLHVDPEVYSNVKRKFRDDKGALALVVGLRNNLAHGSLSFAECGENDTVSELRDLKDRTAAYLREVVREFSDFVSNHAFLRPERRPAPA